jgi:hypothetical protein
LDARCPPSAILPAKRVVPTGTVTINDGQGMIAVSRSFVYEGCHRDLFHRYTSWHHDVVKVKIKHYGAITLEDGMMTASVDRQHRFGVRRNRPIHSMEVGGC